MADTTEREPFRPVPRRAVVLALVGTVVLAITGPLLGFAFAWRGIAAAMALCGLLAGVAVLYGSTGRAPRLAAASAALALLMWLGFVGGFLAYVALAAGAPFVDSSLEAATGIFGFDHLAFTDAISRRPVLVTMLRYAYESTVPIVILTAVGLALAGATERLRTFLGDYAVLLMISVGLSALFPARGPFLIVTLPEAIRARLPVGAGDFHRDIHGAIRDGGMRLFDPAAMDGVVVFPSFHTAMALIVAQALGGVRGLAAASVLYAGLVMIATLPLGGHYLADVLATLALFAMVRLVSVSRLRPSETIGAEARATV